MARTKRKEAKKKPQIETVDAAATALAEPPPEKRVRQKGDGVKCPACKADMFVQSTRPLDDRRYGVPFRRQRVRFYKCAGCGEIIKRVVNVP